MRRTMQSQGEYRYPTAPYLKPDEEKQLILTIQSGTDPRQINRAKDRLIRSYTKFVCKFAHFYFYKTVRQSYNSFDDLMQEGFMALMRAADKYDPNYGVAFATYASGWIRSQMRYAVVHGIGPLTIPNSPNAQRIVYMYSREFQNVARAMPGATENAINERVAANLEMSYDILQSLLQATNPRFSRSLDAEHAHTQISDSSSTVTLHEYIEDENANPERWLEYLQQTQQMDLVQDHMYLLDAREREIIQWRYFQEFTLSDCAERLNVSRERVRQIQDKAERILSDALSGNLSRDLRSRLNRIRKQAVQQAKLREIATA